MSYVSSHFHIVYSTKARVPAISEKIQTKLWAYMAGIAANHGMRALAIGGIEDHVHALISLPATMSIAEAVQLLKANSSRWINEHPRTHFEWQEGYFACSVSRSQISRVSKYIANQRQHHKKRDFAAEFRLLLKRHGFEESAVPSGLCSLLSPTGHFRARLQVLSSRCAGLLASPFLHPRFRVYSRLIFLFSDLRLSVPICGERNSPHPHISLCSARAR